MQTRLQIQLLIALISLGGCAGSKDTILPADGPSMKTIYTEHFTDIGMRDTMSVSPWNGKCMMSNAFAVSMPVNPIFLRTAHDVGPCSDSAANSSVTSVTLTSLNPNALFSNHAVHGLPQVSMNLSSASLKIVPSSIMRPSSVHQTQ